MTVERLRELELHPVSPSHFARSPLPVRPLYSVWQPSSASDAQPALSLPVCCPLPSCCPHPFRKPALTFHSFPSILLFPRRPSIRPLFCRQHSARPPSYRRPC